MFARTTSLVITALICSSVVVGQAGRCEVATQIGPGMGWLRGNKLIDSTDPLFGPSAAVNFHYAVSHRFGVRAGLGYQRKGMFQEVTFTDINGNLLRQVNSRNALDYLVVPVMAQASFGSKARLLVGCGPYAGLLLRSRQSFGDEAVLPSYDNTDDLKQWDIGLSASLGGAFPLSPAVALQAEVRYDKGLSNISALPVIDDGSIRTNAVSLLVGCGYRFGSVL